jgi:hypothetical protein
LLHLLALDEAQRIAANIIAKSPELPRCRLVDRRKKSPRR